MDGIKIKDVNKLRNEITELIIEHMENSIDFKDLKYDCIFNRYLDDFIRHLIK